jgi:prepilin-type N-terminal cleavage/methylation domain-containing protein
MGRSGFTAIELIVTVLIISILMTGVLPTISVLKNSRDVGEELKSAADKVAIELGVSVYQILYDRLPNSVEELIYSGVILGEGTGKLEYVEGIPMLR